jgi:carboxypeptidase PM20D1
MIRHILQGFAGVALALIAVVAIRTALVRAPGAEVEPVPSPALDVDAAAGRLARAVRFRTVSSGPEAPPEAAALRHLHAFLAEAFPRTHAALAREVVGEHSLLFT